MKRYKPRKIDYSQKLTVVNPEKTVTVEVGYTTFAGYDLVAAKFDKVCESMGELAGCYEVKGIAKLDPKDEYNEEVGEMIAYKRALLEGLRGAKVDLVALKKAALALADVADIAILENTAEQAKIKVSIDKLGNR